MCLKEKCNLQETREIPPAGLLHRGLPDVVDGVDITAGIEQELAGDLGTGERGPVKGDVALCVGDEGIGTALQKVPGEKEEIVQDLSRITSNPKGMRTFQF